MSETMIKNILPRMIITVRGNARLVGKIFMRDKALLDGDAILQMQDSLRENARVDGYADIGGCCRIFGDAWVTDEVTIRDKSQVTGDAIIHGRVVTWGKSCMSPENFAFATINITKT
jgi:UDP-3-O-[3-hydroxymyristoyl] glucosamine N-acyltransferase